MAGVTPGSNRSTALRITVISGVVVLLGLALPVRLPVNDHAAAGEACHTIADRPGAPLALLEECTTVIADDPELLADLATAYQAANRTDDAERIHRQILTIDPEYADVHVRLARLLLQRGQAAEARSHLEIALRIQPNRMTIRSLIDSIK